MFVLLFEIIKSFTLNIFERLYFCDDGSDGIPQQSFISDNVSAKSQVSEMNLESDFQQWSCVVAVNSKLVLSVFWFAVQDFEIFLMGKWFSLPSVFKKIHLFSYYFAEDQICYYCWW